MDINNHYISIMLQIEVNGTKNALILFYCIVFSGLALRNKIEIKLYYKHSIKQLIINNCCIIDYISVNHLFQLFRAKRILFPTYVYI